MIAEPIAVRLATELIHARRERAGRPRRHRLTARALQALAVRLDPAVAS
jgi:hypothetical protein